MCMLKEILISGKNRSILFVLSVDRFYSPLSLGKTPLQYYPPVCPSVSTEVDAVVSHINNPADFYIQLVLHVIVCKQIMMLI